MKLSKELRKSHAEKHAAAETALADLVDAREAFETARRKQEEALQQAVKDAVEVYNEACKELHAPVDEAAAAFRTAIEECGEWVEEAASSLEEFHSGKSEKWQEGPKGEAVQNLADELRQWDASGFEVPEFEELIPEDAADAIPTEPSETDSTDAESLVETFGSLPLEAEGA